MARLVYRKPLWALLPMAVVLMAFSLIRRWPGGWLFVVVFCGVWGLLSARQRLVCTADAVQVTVLRTRRVPRSEVRGFEAGPIWLGGTWVLTESGSIWSPAPASWWGGPPATADLRALQRSLPSGRP